MIFLIIQFPPKSTKNAAGLFSTPGSNYLAKSPEIWSDKYLRGQSVQSFQRSLSQRFDFKRATEPGVKPLRNISGTSLCFFWKEINEFREERLLRREGLRYSCNVESAVGCSI